MLTHRSTLVASLLMAMGCAACAGAVPTPRIASGVESSGSPLGPSYVLIPLPGEEEDLLGRILEANPEPGRSLEETARPNPCESKLSAPKTTPLEATFEDAQEMSAGASARAMLGVFGFEGDAKTASHFLYKMTTEKRLSRTDTTEYNECCKEKGCGIGFISALVHGDGEYATGEESSARGSVNMVTAGGGGDVRLRILHKRKVHGWLAALITVTDRTKAAKLGPLGVAAEAGISETGIPQQVKEIYDNNTVKVEGAGQAYVFKVASGEVLTENEFVEKYSNLTGASDLNDVKKRRNWGTVGLWGAGTAAFAGLMVYGMMNTKTNCNADNADVTLGTGSGGGWVTTGDCAITDSTTETRPGFDGTPYDPNAKTTNPLGYVLFGVGAAGVVGFGIPLVIALLNPNGKPDSHYLTDADARIYANRYNRSLLRKTVQDVKRSNAKGPSWLPSVGLGTFGLGGQF